MTLLGPYLAGALVLVGAGVAKLRRPDDLRRAFHRVTRRRLPVRTLAAAETVVGVAAIAHPGALTALPVAGSYAAFALYTAWLRRVGGPLSTCGCFGSPDTAPTRSHIAVDVLFAAAAVAVATAGGGGWLDAPWLLLLVSAVVAGLAAAVFTSLGRLEGIRRSFGVPA